MKLSPCGEDKEYQLVEIGVVAGPLHNLTLSPLYPGIYAQLPNLAIYAHMIFTAQCIMFWLGAYPLGQVGGGWPWKSRVFGPCEMASSR